MVVSAHANRGDFHGAGDALRWAIRCLGPRAAAIYARDPLTDPTLPRTSDIDLLLFADVPALMPERLWAPAPLPPVDLMWLPRETLKQPERLAGWGLIAHRLAGSRLVAGPDEALVSGGQTALERLWLPQVRAARMNGLLEMGYATVLEVGVSWDFPQLALLWLQIAWCSLIAARADAQGRLVPNVYTRPFDALESLGKDAGRLAEFPQWLAVAPAELPRLVALTRRIHREVALRCPEPAWPDAYRADTRAEYRYYASARELEWRIDVALEMASIGQGTAAVLYLRFWAYSLARIPVVHRCVGLGESTSFGRPSRPMLGELQRSCPSILDDLREVLGGAGVGRDALMQALAEITVLRAATIEHIQRLGLPLLEPRPWRPWHGSRFDTAPPVPPKTEQ